MRIDAQTDGAVVPARNEETNITINLLVGSTQTKLLHRTWNGTFYIDSVAPRRLAQHYWAMQLPRAALFFLVVNFSWSVLAFPCRSSPRSRRSRRSASIMEPWTIMPSPTETYHDLGQSTEGVNLSPLAFQIMAHYQANGMIEVEAPGFARAEHVENPYQ